MSITMYTDKGSQKSSQLSLNFNAQSTAVKNSQKTVITTTLEILQKQYEEDHLRETKNLINLMEKSGCRKLAFVKGDDGKTIPTPIKDDSSIE